MKVVEVAEVFSKHYEHHRTIEWNDRARDLGSEREISKDYAGRVVFELFQNAIDRANQSIWIASQRVDQAGVLLVANDGQSLRVNQAYEYDDENAERMDFHALCSMYTSGKDPSEAIGNKGIGFRSVFTLGPRAVVWSRLADGGWWGLGLGARERGFAHGAWSLPRASVNPGCGVYTRR